MFWIAVMITTVDQKSNMRYIGLMKTMNIRPIARPSLREQIYRALKRAIATLELEPGQRLKDSDLAEQFGVSRTPVREALRQLEDEGLVETIPGSLTRVKELNIEEARQAFTVVAALHALAARLAVPLLEERDLELMEERNEAFRVALEAGDILAAVDADDEFHDVILTASGNKEISVALERVVPKIRRLEFSKFGSFEALMSYEQHNSIIETCRKGDAQEVSRLLEAHWMKLEEVLTRRG